MPVIRNVVELKVASIYIRIKVNFTGTIIQQVDELSINKFSFNNFLNLWLTLTLK